MNARSSHLQPFYVELAAGQTVLWCRCGKSRQQPYCDGSHQGSGFVPIRYQAQKAEEVLLCGCKQTRTGPHCDGSHNALAQDYANDDAQSLANRDIVEIEPDADGKARIDGGCFVCKVDARPWRKQGNALWTDLINDADGACFQAQFCFDFAPGIGPVVSFGDRHVALLVLDQFGVLEIGSQPFALDTRIAGDKTRSAEVGAYVKPGECFRVTNQGDRAMRVFASTGPTTDTPQFLEQLPDQFDASAGRRLAPVNPAERQAMADRFFQVLVGKTHGSPMLTQFIGEIPKGKAWPHRHLYEESLIVVAGEGMMWTETRKTRVVAGDVIFLPRKQTHSLECTSDSPMFVAGVIYPGDNPSINYYP